MPGGPGPADTAAWMALQQHLLHGTAGQGRAGPSPDRHDDSDDATRAASAHSELVVHTSVHQTQMVLATA